MIRRNSFWIVPVFVTLLFTSVTGDSGRLPEAASEGITVTLPLPFVVESLGEVRERAPMRAQGPSGDRAIPYRGIQRPAPPAAGFATWFDSGVATSPEFGSSAPVAAPRAPALDCSFAGHGNPGPGSDVIPPDTMGAAGPNHLVSILNSDFGVFDKTTGMLSGSAVPLTSFWDSVWDLPPVVPRPPPRAFDPKILYDTHSGRFIAVTLAGLSGTESWLLIAVSSTSNPLDSWVKLKIDADLDNNAQLFNNSADYPGLGVDNTNIYVSANMYDDFDGYKYSKVWAFPKDQFLAGSLPSPLTWYEFRDPPGSDSTMQPAHGFDNTSTEYFVYEAGSGLLRLASITSTGGTPTWNNLGNVPVASFDVNFDLPRIPQFGNDNGINSSDTRLLNAVFRNGSLWTTHHVAVGGKLEVAWYQINPLAGSVAAQGRISDPSRWYAYPSIAVNKDGDAAIGFNGSSATEYMSAYFTVRKAASGTMQPVTLLKSGEAPYYKTLSGPDNRWGDFSATMVDPSDNVSFWTLQEYAESPANGRSMWGTWWGKFRSPSIAAPTSLAATAVSPTQINLGWTDLSSDELGFKVERKFVPAGDYSVIATLGADNTSYIDSTGLTGGSTYSYRVQSFNASGGSYSGEAVATAQTPPPAPSGGGGGGGCSMSKGKEEAGDLPPVATVLVLLSPAAILAVRRKIKR